MDELNGLEKVYRSHHFFHLKSESLILFLSKSKHFSAVAKMLGLVILKPPALQFCSMSTLAEGVMRSEDVLLMIYFFSSVISCFKILWNGAQLLEWQQNYN